MSTYYRHGICLVPRGGLEPPHLSATDFESALSTDSIIWAYCRAPPPARRILLKARMTRLQFLYCRAGLTARRLDVLPRAPGSRANSLGGSDCTVQRPPPSAGGIQASVGPPSRVCALTDLLIPPYATLTCSCRPHIPDSPNSTAAKKTDGAQRGTRTPTPFGTSSSGLRVYQFHHLGDVFLYYSTKQVLCNSYLVGPDGIEPSTSAFVARRSVQLSYGPADWWGRWDSNPRIPGSEPGGLDQLTFTPHGLLVAGACLPAAGASELASCC